MHTALDTAIAAARSEALARTAAEQRRDRPAATRPRRFFRWWRLRAA